MTRPDISDPGYSQIGCFLTGIGMITGLVIASLVAVTGLVPDPNPSGTHDLGAWLVAVSLIAFTVGMLASFGVISIVQRVRPLWRIEDGVFVGCCLVVPAVVVILLALTPAGAALVDPLGKVAFTIWVVGGVLSLVVGLWIWLRRM